MERDIVKKPSNLDIIAKGLGTALLGVLFIFLVAVASGTILWAIYPHIFAMFPTAKGTVLAPTLGWWDSVCVVWIFSCLIRTTTKADKAKES